eukprot:Colp12_sorted_trinity150504_noHs@28371
MKGAALLSLFVACVMVAGITAMGTPPSECHNRVPTKLLRTRVIATHPDGTKFSKVINKSVTNPLEILIYSEWTLELTLQSDRVPNGRIWIDSNYFGYMNGMCFD